MPHTQENGFFLRPSDHIHRLHPLSDQTGPDLLVTWTFAKLTHGFVWKHIILPNSSQGLVLCDLPKNSIVSKKIDEDLDAAAVAWRAKCWSPVAVELTPDDEFWVFAICPFWCYWCCAWCFLIIIKEIVTKNLAHPDGDQCNFSRAPSSGRISII